ncbi:hypothetical protein HN51_014571 [Arachis hypogaea]
MYYRAKMKYQSQKQVSTLSANEQSKWSPFYVVKGMDLLPIYTCIQTFSCLHAASYRTHIRPFKLTLSLQPDNHVAPDQPCRHRR